MRDAGHYIAAAYSEDSPRENRRGYTANFKKKLAADPDRFGNVNLTVFEPPIQLSYAQPDSADLVLTFRNLHNWLSYGEDNFKRVFQSAYALMLIAIISYGAYTAALRSKPQMHWASLMFALCLGATLSFLPMLALEMSQGATIFPDLRGSSVIAYIVIFLSLLGQVCYIRGVELIGSNRGGLFVNLLPIWGALLCGRAARRGVSSLSRCGVDDGSGRDRAC